MTGADLIAYPERASLKGQWRFEDATAAGCSNHKNYLRNPLFRLDLLCSKQIAPTAHRTAPPASLRITARLRIINGIEKPLNLSVYATGKSMGIQGGDGLAGGGTSSSDEGLELTPAALSAGLHHRLNPKRAICTSNNGVYLNVPSGVALVNQSLSISADALGTNTNPAVIASWVLIPSTFDPEPGEFAIDLYSSVPNVRVTRLQ